MIGDAERRAGAFDAALEEAFAPRGGGEEVMGDENATPFVGDSEVVTAAEAAAAAAAAGLEVVASSFLGGLSFAPAAELR